MSESRLLLEISHSDYERLTELLSFTTEELNNAFGKGIQDPASFKFRIRSALGFGNGALDAKDAPDTLSMFYHPRTETE